MLKNQTRTELWKKYRQDINKNILLQKSVLVSNQKLSILYNRLIAIYPDYKIKYDDLELSKNSKIKVKEIKDPTLLDVEDLKKIVDEINEFENQSDYSFNFLNEMNFSSGNLDDVINMVKQGKISKIDYINTTNKDTQIIKAKKIVLAKGGK